MKVKYSLPFSQISLRAYPLYAIHISFSYVNHIASEVLLGYQKNLPFIPIGTVACVLPCMKNPLKKSIFFRRESWFKSRNGQTNSQEYKVTRTNEGSESEAKRLWQPTEDC